MRSARLLPRVIPLMVLAAKLATEMEPAGTVMVEVAVMFPTVNFPMDDEARKESTKRPMVEKRDVEVAFVESRFVKVPRVEKKLLVEVALVVVLLVAVNVWRVVEPERRRLAMEVRPEELTESAVEVAPAVPSATMERRERLESEEVAETVSTESGDEVPRPSRVAELGYIARGSVEVAHFSFGSPPLPL